MKKIITHYILTILLLILLTSCSATSNQTGINNGNTVASNVNIGISFPPLGSIDQLEFTHEHLSSLNITRIRYEEHWNNREPIDNQYDWIPSDTRINFLTSNNYSILLTISSDAPDWFRAQVTTKNSRSCSFGDNTQFQSYINDYLNRYHTKIDYIQFGNEWQSEYWYAGNEYEFVSANNTLYNQVQLVDPDLPVVLGGFSIGALNFMAAYNGLLNSYYDDNGDLITKDYVDSIRTSPNVIEFITRIEYVLNNAKYDIVDLHLYDDYDNWETLYNMIKSIVPDKPVIVSEFGGPHPGFPQNYSDEIHGELFTNYIRTLNKLVIIAAYNFGLIDKPTQWHSTNGFIRTDLSLKPAYYKLKEIQNGK